MKRFLPVLLAVVLLVTARTACADLQTEIRERTERYNEYAREYGIPELETDSCRISEDQSFTRYYFEQANGLEIAFLTRDGEKFIAGFVRFGTEENFADFTATSMAAAAAMTGDPSLQESVFSAFLKQYFKARSGADDDGVPVGKFVISVSRHDQGYLFIALGE